MKNILGTNVTAKGLFNVARQLKDYTVDKPYEILQQAEQLAVEGKEYDLACDILTFSGRMNRIRGNFYKCLAELNSAFKIHTTRLNQDKIRLGQIYRELSTLYGDGFNNWPTSIEYAKKCIKLNIEELNAIFYNNIASGYISNGQHNEAIPFLEKGKVLAEEAENYYVLSFIYENFGDAFRRLNEIDKSIHFLNEGIIACKKAYESHSIYQEVLLVNCFLLAAMVKTYIDKANFTQARFYIDQLREIATKNSLVVLIDTSYLLEAQIEFSNENYDKYIALYEEYIQQASSDKYYISLAKWYKGLLFIYESRGQYKEALQVSKQLVQNMDRHSNKTYEVSISDFLETKEAEILELINTNQEIKLQKEELEQFAYIVTHDLKTPLSNIANYAGLLLKKNAPQIDASGKEYIDTIISNSQDLSYMLTGLMNYATLGDSDEVVIECDLGTVLNGVLSQLSNHIISAKAEINLDATATLKMRKVHLQQLLTNLILNAIKFSKPETPAIIDIYTKENVLSTNVIISDNGIGINPDYNKQIFQIFNRLEKNKYKGYGMGLAICKKIVDSYGGRIWVDPNEHGGSSFQFAI